jgi:hypothetical protein
MSSNADYFLYMPWLPFFSNCDGYDSHIHFNRLIETHPDCMVTFKSLKKTTFVVQMPSSSGFTYAEPFSDKCVNPLDDGFPEIDDRNKFGAGTELQCSYEEDPSNAGSSARWFELSGGEVAFYLTKKPIFPPDFVTDWSVIPTPTADPRWGRSYFLWQKKDTEQALPVKVDPDFFSAVGVMPRRVKLYVEYFQVRDKTPASPAVALALSFPSRPPGATHHLSPPPPPTAAPHRRPSTADPHRRPYRRRNRRAPSGWCSPSSSTSTCATRMRRRRSSGSCSRPRGCSRRPRTVSARATTPGTATCRTHSTRSSSR